MDKDSRRLKISNNTLNSKLRKTLAGVFHLEVSGLSINDNIDTIERWDSLTHIEVVIAIEQAFNIVLPTKLIPKLTSVRIIQKTLRDKGVI